MPQNEIKMSAPLSHRLNIKDNPVKYTWLAGEMSRMLSFKPVTHNTGPEPEPVDHPGTLRDHANSNDLSNVVVF